MLKRNTDYEGQCYFSVSPQYKYQIKLTSFKRNFKIRRTLTQYKAAEKELAELCLFCFFF